MNEDKVKTKTINPVIAVFVVLQILFIIFIFISFQKVFEIQEPVLSTSVAGLEQEIESLPEDAKKEIDYSVYQAVVRNTIDSGNVQKHGVLIRSNSLIEKQYENMNVNYVSFIADIPDIQQSYRVIYVWSDDFENQFISPDYKAVTLCLPDDQLIYDGFDCKDDKEYIKKEIVYNLIRGNDYSIPGYKNVGISFVSNPQDDNFRINYSYLSCETQCICTEVSAEQEEEIVRAFEEQYIYGIGFLSEEIPYSFDNCGSSLTE